MYNHSVQPSEHSERFVERLLRLLHWTTVRSERSLNGCKRQIGVFVVANKDGGAHRVFFIMQKYSISPRLWAITEEFELSSDTWPFAEQWSFSAQTVCCCIQKTKRSLGWTDPGWNSGMIVSGWLSRTALDWPKSVTQNRRTLAADASATSNVSISVMLAGKCLSWGITTKLVASSNQLVIQGLVANRASTKRSKHKRLSYTTLVRD